MKLIANHSSYQLLKEPEGEGWVARRDIMREAVPSIYPHLTSMERYLRRLGARKLGAVGMLQKRRRSLIPDGVNRTNKMEFVLPA